MKHKIQMKYKFKWNHDEIIFPNDFWKKNAYQKLDL